MALFKVLRGARSRLNNVEKMDGHAYFCPDDGSFHIDYLDDSGILQRKQLNAQTLTDFLMSNQIQHDGELLSDILNMYLLSIDYSTLAFDTTEIVIGNLPNNNKTAILGQAILGQMVLA